MLRIGGETVNLNLAFRRRENSHQSGGDSKSLMNVKRKHGSEYIKKKR